MKQNSCNCFNNICECNDKCDCKNLNCGCSCSMQINKCNCNSTNCNCKKKITKDTPLIDALNINPYAADILMRYGMGCTICPASFMETIEDAAMVHSMDIDSIIEDLNEDYSEYEKMGLEPFDLSMYGIYGDFSGEEFEDFSNSHFELPKDLEEFENYDLFSELMNVDNDVENE